MEHTMDPIGYLDVEPRDVDHWIVISTYDGDAQVGPDYRTCEEAEDAIRTESERYHAAGPGRQDSWLPRSVVGIRTDGEELTTGYYPEYGTDRVRVGDWQILPNGRMAAHWYDDMYGEWDVDAEMPEKVRDRIMRVARTVVDGWDIRPARIAVVLGEHGANPVGAVEIADRLGVETTTVAQWKQRGLLPAPAWTVGGRDAWRWSEIEEWARETGRLPASRGPR